MIHFYVSTIILCAIYSIAVSNNLSGSLPYELNHFSDLVVLNMYYNDLTGSIPHLSGLIALEQLDLDGNKLSGKVPETLFNLPSIRKSCEAFLYF